MEGSSPPEDRAGKLFAEWLARPDTQEDFEWLCRENGEHAAELRELLLHWLRIEPILRLAGFGLDRENGHSFAERLKQEYGSGVDPAIALEEGREEAPTGELLKRLSEHGLKRSRYALKGELARGGMGAILKVWDEDLRRSLAMKVILGKEERSTGGETPPVDRRLLARFLEEAQVTGQLDHPGIVPVHELGLDAEGRVYFTMKLVKGRDLRAIFELVFAGEEGWNETRALGVLLKVCEAMAYAHAKGVIHRDLKPANVMVGGFGEVYVMDWGLARVLGRADQHDLRLREEAPLSSVKTERREERSEAPDSPLFTMDGDVVGTPAYMPPEQALGAVERLSPRSDVYAIGAMLYHLLARHMPYVPPGGRMTNRIVLLAVTQGPPAPLATLRRDAPAELVAIVERAMAREPERRYRDTLELADDLRAYLEHRVVAAYETGAWAETKKWVQRNRALAASLAMVVGLLAVGLTVLQASNADLAKATEEAQTNELKALQSEALAQEARAEAIDRTREARASLYAAAIAGAQSARRSNEPSSVRRLLASAPENLRNWEWRYLNAVSDGSLFTLEGVNSASFSPDGSRIVTACVDNTARVWDTTSAKELARFEGHGGRVYMAAFSPDGAYVVTASQDKTARVWDGTSGAELAALAGHKGTVMIAAFSPDGARVATASLDTTARVWDWRSRTELARFYGDSSETPSQVHSISVLALERWTVPAGSMSSLSFSGDGSRIVTTSYDKTARLWDVAAGKESVRIEGESNVGSMERALFSPDGGRVATSSWGAVDVWDGTSGKNLYRLKGTIGGLSSPPYSQPFDPDGKRIVTIQSDEAQVWDCIAGKELERLSGHSRELSSASFSPDGARIVTTSRDNTLRLWDAADGTSFGPLEGHKDVVYAASFSADGLHILSVSRDHTARVWEGTTTSVFMLGGSGRACFSPDQSRLAAASQSDVRIWDTADGRELQLGLGGVTHVAFSPDGSSLVTASQDHTARVWNAVYGTEIAVLEGHTDDLTIVAFSADGSRIVTASRDETARVWDATSGKELGRFQGDTRGVLAGWIDGSGLRYVTAQDDGSVLFMDGTRGVALTRLSGPAQKVEAVACRPDLARIAAASEETVRIWDATTGVELTRLEGHTAVIRSIDFSPDGSRIVTASSDSTARIWEASSGKELLRLEGHTSGVTSASFSPDGSRIVTTSWDGTVRVWDCVSNRVRHAERRALAAARPAGQQLAEEALLRSESFAKAESRVRKDDALEPLIRRTALEALGERARAVLSRANQASAKRLERAWYAHLAGNEPWPDESDVEATLVGLPTDASRLNDIAWNLVDPREPVFGSEVRALLLARRAIAAALPDAVNECRDTLSRALYRLGRFDEALAEQQRALAEASPETRAAYEARLRRLEADIATWRDESGELRRAEIEQRIHALDREIAALEQDPDVRRWIAEESKPAR